MSVVISHPTGNANVRAAISGLWNLSLLNRFHTSVATFPGDFLDMLSHYQPFKEFRRRQFDPGLKSVTQTWPWMEIGRLFSQKAGLRNLLRHEQGLFCIDAVYRNLDKQVAFSLRQASKKGVNAVYAYEDGASLSFSHAKSLGMTCLYDLPIGYWRSAQVLLHSEKERWPEWNSTLIGLQDSDAKLTRKDQELSWADRIFVASSFSAKTLRDFPGTLAPIEVIPYGFPPVNGTRSYTGISRRPLKLLFVGGLSQRKGIANLFTAVNTIGSHVTLTVVGQKVNDNCPVLNAELSKCKWIPTLPHQEILRLMQEHDVLVFPSLFEGFGLVITEAMSQGTPVITTERTAGPDFITHGCNGWLTEAGSTSSLISAIEQLMHNPEQIRDAGKAAMETARNRPWQAYGNELARAVKKSISSI